MAISTDKGLILILMVEKMWVNSENGEYQGQRTHSFPDDGVYIGEYKDGKRHGQGTYTFPDGAKYAGGWKNNHFHGQGNTYKI